MGLLEPVVIALGFELVGVEYFPQGQRSVLRVYIDAPSGVTIDDCGRVSHQVSGLLDVEEPIKGQFTLEVSSPGLERPLFRADHYAQFRGRRVRLRLNRPQDGRRKINGIIDHVEGNSIFVQDLDEGDIKSLELEDIDKANLVPEL